MNQLLPEDASHVAQPIASGGVRIDLTTIDGLDADVGKVVDLFLQRIQIQRQDFNGKVLTIRSSDVAVLAMLLEVTDADLLVQLDTQ